MKHCFVVNPAAGRGGGQRGLLPRIFEAAERRGAEFEVHRTSGPGEAVSFVRGRVASGGGAAIRFYACGGDGTAAEVLNGMYGAAGAELAVVPVGSGNDFVRNFGGQGRFLDIGALMDGAAAPVDVIRYAYAGAEGDGGGMIIKYALNMINMGFDAKAAMHMARMKGGVLSGKGLYVAGVVRELMGYGMSRAVFSPRGEGGAGAEAFEAEILLAGVGSGRFSGGGFDGIPCAEVDDGWLDLIVIEPLTRREFVRLVGVYHDGRHLSHPLLAERTRLLRVKGVRIEPVGGLVFSADGEALHTDGALDVGLAEEKLMFVRPRLRPERSGDGRGA